MPVLACSVFVFLPGLEGTGSISSLFTGKTHVASLKPGTLQIFSEFVPNQLAELVNRTGSLIVLCHCYDDT